MRPLGRLNPFAAAEERVRAALPPTRRTESSPLVDAVGRVLAADIVAPIDVPGFDRSAMDGYALRGADTRTAAPGAPVRLRLAGAVHAGPRVALELRQGECIQIATGAPLPRGADAVVMVEHTRTDGNDVLLERSIQPRENVSPQGGDVRKGSRVLAAGSLITPPRVATLAALGLGTVSLHDRPRVGLLSTGSELRTPGQDLGPGLIYDSNTPALEAVLRQHHAKVERLGILPDELGRLERVLTDAAPRFDLLLVTGSSSAGERDYLVDALGTVGRIDLHGVDVKPGKPLLLGHVAQTPLVGLAGNPASCTLMTYALLVPALRRWQHLPAESSPPRPARLAHDLASPRGKRHFVPVRLRGEEAENVFRESDATTSLADADGFLEVPEETERLPKGSPVLVRPF